MPHDNGRIYTETRNGVHYGVTTEDVAAVLGQSSLDVATLCRASNINPWAKYRPLPIPKSDAQCPVSFATESLRKARNYGLNLESRYSLFSNYIVVPTQVIGEIRNNIITENDMLVAVKPWLNNAEYYYRLLDFAKVDDNGNIINNVGYNHNAVAATDEVTVNETVYRMASPIFPLGQRTINIEEGATFRVNIPDDTDFLRAMHEYTNYNIGVLNEHQEALSVFDVLNTVASNHSLYSETYGAAIRCVHLIAISGVTKKDEVVNNNMGYANAIYGDTRGVISMISNNVAREGYDRSKIEDENQVTQIDFSENSQQKIYNWYDEPYELGRLSGQLWVMEYYRVKNAADYLPILGYVYKININRVAAGAASVDIDGLLYFDRFDEYLFLILRSNVADLHSYLTSQYTMLKLSVGNVEVNLLDSSAMTYSQGEQITQGGYRGWYEYYIDTHDAFTDSSQTTGIVSSIKSGQSVTANKTISVRIY